MDKVLIAFKILYLFAAMPLGLYVYDIIKYSHYDPSIWFVLLGTFIAIFLIRIAEMYYEAGE